MILYKNCNHVSFDDLFEAFQIGYSDYIVKIEMTKEVFWERFFGPEGNQLENSFIAFDDRKPIGLILGGIKKYEGINTLRCGSLCVHPDYRGKGVSKELFQLHKQIAIDKGCKQMFLEVIVGNDRAIKFYHNLGYEKIYDIKYYAYETSRQLKNKVDTDIELKSIDFKVIRSLSKKMTEIHINWQNDFDYMEKQDNLVHYGAYKNAELIGALSLNTSGKISFLWVRPEFRNKGIGRTLIANALKEHNLEKLMISFPNSSSLEGFLRHNHFKKEKITLYEMYLNL